MIDIHISILLISFFSSQEGFAYMYSVLQSLCDVDGRDEHCKDVFRERGEKLDDERTLEAGYGQGNDDDPETDPGSPDEKFDFRIF